MTTATRCAGSIPIAGVGYIVMYPKDGNKYVAMYLKSEVSAGARRCPSSEGACLRSTCRRAERRRCNSYPPHSGEYRSGQTVAIQSRVLKNSAGSNPASPISDQYGPVAGGYTPVIEVIPLGRYGKLIRPGVVDIEYG